MIEMIEGKLVDLTTSKATLMVHGMGYGVFITLTTFDRLISKVGKEIILFTTQIIREDSNRLFGFTEKKEKELFEILFPEIGPKTTVSLLGHLSKEILKEAIEFGQIETLIRVPGIGKKSAERIILELKGKLGEVCQESSSSLDAVDALVHLGYTAAEAQKKIQRAQESLPASADLKELLKVALQVKT